MAWPENREAKIQPWKALYTERIDFPPDSRFLQRAAEVGLELKFIDGYSSEEIIEQGADCQAVFLLHGRVTSRMIGELRSCRILARVGTGYDLIDAGAAAKAGVMVTNVPDFCSDEMSDTVMMFILALSRQLPVQWRAAVDHHWMSLRELPDLERLRGMTLGILGFGGSGRKTAEKANAFGLDVRVWTRTRRPEIEKRYGVEAVSFSEALQSDFLSIHLPSTPATRMLIDADAIAQMKPGIRLINVARGDIVDTQSLCEAISSGHISGAGLDVVDPEPLPADHQLWELPNVMITPHTAAISRQALEQSFSIALEDVISVLQGSSPKHPVPELQTQDDGL